MSEPRTLHVKLIPPEESRKPRGKVFWASVLATVPLGVFLFNLSQFVITQARAEARSRAVAITGLTQQYYEDTTDSQRNELKTALTIHQLALIGTDALTSIRAIAFSFNFPNCRIARVISQSLIEIAVDDPELQQAIFNSYVDEVEARVHEAGEQSSPIAGLEVPVTALRLFSAEARLMRKAENRRRLGDLTQSLTRMGAVASDEAAYKRIVNALEAEECQDE